MTPSKNNPTVSRTYAYGVHFYTASGVFFALLTALELLKQTPDVRWIFFYFFTAVVIDGTDGTLARKCNVKHWVPKIDGRTIDDIVDYINYAFLPLLLIARMGWVPGPTILWITPALVASLFGFANNNAKDETKGYFLGFPSYWNFVAYFAGIWAGGWGDWLNVGVLVSLTILTVLPIKFIYPNLAPKPWRGWVMGGAIVWLLFLFVTLSAYPNFPVWMKYLGLSFPVLYAFLSLYLFVF